MNLTEQDLLDNLIATPDESNQKVQTLIHQNREKKLQLNEANTRIASANEGIAEQSHTQNNMQDKKDQKGEGTAKNEEEEKNLPRLKVIKKNKQQHNLKQISSDVIEYKK